MGGGGRVKRGGGAVTGNGDMRCMHQVLPTLRLALVSIVLFSKDVRSKIHPMPSAFNGGQPLESLQTRY